MSKDPQKETAKPVNKDPEFIQPEHNAAFNIEQLWVKGDILSVVVNYSGGCAGHRFDAWFNGNFMKSLPPKANIFITHDNNNDACRSNVTDTLEFDLKNVRYGEKGKVILLFNNTDKTVDYNY